MFGARLSDALFCAAALAAVPALARWTFGIHLDLGLLPSIALEVISPGAWLAAAAALTIAAAVVGRRARQSTVLRGHAAGRGTS